MEFLALEDTSGDGAQRISLNAIQRLQAFEGMGGPVKPWTKQSPQSLLTTRSRVDAYMRQCMLSDSISLVHLWNVFVTPHTFPCSRWGLQDYTRPTRVQRNGLVYREWPLRLCFSYQTLLLMIGQPNGLLDKILKEFQRQLDFANEDAKLAFELVEKAPSTPGYLLDGLQDLKTRIGAFMNDVLGDLMRPENPEALDVPSPNRIFHQQPELCGLVLMELKTKLHAHGLMISKVFEDLYHIAGIYSVLVSASLISHRWIDMEDFLDEIGNKAFFGGTATPSSGGEARQRYWKHQGCVGPAAFKDGRVTRDETKMTVRVPLKVGLAEELTYRSFDDPKDQVSYNAKLLNSLITKHGNSGMLEKLVREPDGTRFVHLVDPAPKGKKVSKGRLTLPEDKAWEQSLRSAILHIETDIKEMDFPYIQYFDAARQVSQRLRDELLGENTPLSSSSKEWLRKRRKADPEMKDCSFSLAKALILTPGVPLNTTGLARAAQVLNGFIGEKLPPKTEDSNGRPVYRGGAVRVLRLERGNISPEDLGGIGKKKMSQGDINDMSIPKSDYSGSPFKEDRTNIRWKVAEGGVERETDK